MTSGYLERPTLSEHDRMIKKLEERAAHWRREAIRVRSADNLARGETAGIRYDTMAYELEWAVKRITGEGG